MPVSTRRTATPTSPAPARKAISRKVTSAIPGLSVAQVRRVLDTIRRSWGDRDETPFELSAHAIEDMNVQQFALAFVIGHHQKRHARKRQARERRAGAGTGGGGE